MPAPVSHLNVITLDNHLLVTWRGGDKTVSVFVSDNPEDAGVAVYAPDAVGRAMVPKSTGARSFVHLFDPSGGFTVVAERRVEMDGPRNLRDLGGYPTSSGRFTRWGRVFRSDRLDGTTDADQARLVDLGITKVFDLRADAEVADSPDQLPAGIELVRLPMSSDGAQARSIMERIEAGVLLKFDESDMSNGYLVMLDEFAGHVAQVVEAVANGDRVLFHCTAGKDRTGIVAMVLLSICGVGTASLLDDYELTNMFSQPQTDWISEALEAKGLDPAGFATLWTAPRPVMRSAIEGMQRTWGDIGGYLRHAGIGIDVANTLRAQMLCDDQVS